MFLTNKYTNLYNSIIQNSILRNWTSTIAPVYTEMHHIIPRCCEGTNDLSNLACLTAREHYLVHLLLTKMLHKTNPLIKKLYMAYDLMCMSYKDPNQLKFRYKPRTSILYSLASKLSRDSKLGIPRSDETKRKISEALKARDDNGWTGRKHSDKSKEQMSKAKLGRPGAKLGTKLSDEARKNISDAHKGLPAWNKGKKSSAETRAKLSASHKGKQSNNKGKTPSEETRKRISEGQTGYMWIHNDLLLHQTRIKRGIILPEGYEIGKLSHNLQLLRKLPAATT